MSLIVVRHGESLWNKENKFTGKTDIGLTNRGTIEAIECGEILKEYVFDKVYVSSLKRTHQTYEYIKNVTLKHNISPIISESLDERDYGELTGKNKLELKEMYGEDAVFAWRRGYTDTPPKGECLKDVMERVGKYYEQSIALDLHNNENILIISHGNTLRALFVYLGIIHSNDIHNFEIPTGIPIGINYNNKTYWYENKYELDAYQILDSRGNPTIEAVCYNKDKQILGKGSCPSGASCGSTEMCELRDKDILCYQGKSVYSAIENIKIANASLILNDSTITKFEKIDKQLMNLDTTELKSEIGGNAITAMSFCMLDVASRYNKCEMYEYIRKYMKSESIDKYLPTPFVNIINGGKHGITYELKIQEFMIYTKHDISASKKVQIVTEIYYNLRSILVMKYGIKAKVIGDEGGFCPPITSPNEALYLIEEAIEKSGYVVNTDVFIALDCAANEFYNKSENTYEIEPNIHLYRDELISYYGSLIEEHPALKSIEDPFHESDYIAWRNFTKQYGDRIMVVGDDLYTSNKKYITQGLHEQWANTLLLKVNQVGTVSEAIEGAKLMFEKKKQVIVSHRSGETNHAYLIDIAVGIGARYVKIGSPCRGERVAKFNRLIEIENKMM